MMTEDEIRWGSPFSGYRLHFMLPLSPFRYLCWPWARLRSRAEDEVRWMFLCLCRECFLFERVKVMYVVCPKSSCIGLAEEWDVNWWRTPPALFTQQDPVDVQ